MSKFTDFAENQLADFARGQDLTLPTSWFLGLASAADDTGVTELSGTGYARQEVARSLTAWAGTQSPGSTSASTGTSHATSNNAVVDFGTSGAAWGTAAFVVFFDDATAGTAWAYLPIGPPIVVGSATPVTLSAGSVAATLGIVGGMTNYLSNKMIDLLFRGQAYFWPVTLWAGYTTTTSTNATPGAEPAVGAYSRAYINSSFFTWEGTQGGGSTAPSSGTSGRISNLSALTFGVPTADQGDVVGAILADEATGGNVLFWTTFATPKTIQASGDAPSFSANSLGITWA